MRRWAVNAEVTQLYWQLGRDILDQQGRKGGGAKVTDRVAHDLKGAFPEARRGIYAAAAAQIPGFHLCHPNSPTCESTSYSGRFSARE